MLRIECDCEYMFKHEGKIVTSLDIDTMYLEYSGKGLEFTCPQCKNIYHIIMV